MPDQPLLTEPAQEPQIGAQSLCSGVSRKRWLCYLLIGFVVLLVWGHTVTFQFVWDDEWFIRDHKTIQSLKNVPAMFYSLEAQSSLPEGFALFRPLRTLHYALLYVAGPQEGPVPWLYHLANVLWHGVAALLLFSVLTRLFRRQPELDQRRAQALALIVSVGFAAHPVVSEVVCWAKSLDDIMATVFTLAATGALLRWDGNSKQYGWALFYFLLAVYSKESAVPFVAIAFVLFRQVHKFSWRESARYASGFAAVALLFMVHRHLVIGRTSQTAPISGTYAQTLIDMMPVVPKYVRLLLGVPPFFIDYSYLQGHYGLLSLPVLEGAALLAALIGLMVWTWKRPQLQLIGLGLAWVGLFLVPVSNVVPMMQYMAERFLYLPLIGWLLAIATVLLKVRRRSLSLFAGSAVVLVWIPLAWQRSLIWKDELTLFVESSQQGPRSRRLEQNGVAAIFHLPQVRELFELDKARRKLKAVAAISPEKGRLALRTLSEGQRLFPDDENIATAVAITCVGLGKTNEALSNFELAARQAPGVPDLWNNLALAYVEAGKMNKARAAIEKALALNPESINSLRSASRIYWQSGDFPAALSVLKKLQKLEPNNQDHAYWIGRVQEKLARPPGNN